MGFHEREFDLSDRKEVVLYAEFTAKPGAAAVVDELVSGFAQTVRAEPGNLTFDVYRRAESPDRFVVFEVYRDSAAFDEHLAAESGRAFNAELRDLIVEAGSELNFLVAAGQ